MDATDDTSDGVFYAVEVYDMNGARKGAWEIEGTFVDATPTTDNGRGEGEEVTGGIHTVFTELCFLLVVSSDK